MYRKHIEENHEDGVEGLLSVLGLDVPDFDTSAVDDEESVLHGLTLDQLLDPREMAKAQWRQEKAQGKTRADIQSEIEDTIAKVNASGDGTPDGEAAFRADTRAVLDEIYGLQQ